MQPRRHFVDFVVLDDGKDNRQPQREENDKRNEKRQHIKEKYAPRKIQHKADRVDKKRVVLLGRIACKNHRRANPH